MKSRKIILLLIMLSLCFCTAGLSACKGKFDDVNLKVSACTQIAGTSFACEFTENENKKEGEVDAFLNLYMRADDNGNLEYIPFEPENGGTSFSEAYVFVKITGVPDGYSTSFVYENTNSGVCDVVYQKSVDALTGFDTEEGAHRVKIVAISGGSTQLKFYPQAGGKDKAYIVEVNVNCPLESMELNPTYYPYVIAGKDTKLSTASAFVFTPNVSTQKNITYTLLNGEGQTLTPQENDTQLFDGENVVATLYGQVLQVSENFAYDTIYVKAVNYEYNNGNDSFIIPVKVIKDLKENDITLKIAGQDITSIMLSNNVLSEMTKVVEVSINVPSDEVIVNFESSDESVFTIQDYDLKTSGAGIRVYEVDISSNFLGNAFLDIKITYNGYTYEYKKQYEVNVVNYTNGVNVTGDFKNNKLYVYNSYFGGGLSGEMINISTTPTKSHDSRFLIYVAPQDLEYINIRIGTQNANVVTNISNLIYGEVGESYLYASGINLNITSAKNVNAHAVDIYFISYHSLNYADYEYLDLTSTINTKLNVNIRNGIDAQNDISAINYTLNETFLIEKNKTNTLSFAFPSSKYTDYIDVTIENENVATLTQGENGRLFLEDCSNIYGGSYFVAFDILGLNQGETDILIRFANGANKTLKLRVFVEVDGFIISSNKDTNNSNSVGKIEYDIDSSVTTIYLANNNRVTLNNKVYILDGQDNKIFETIYVEKNDFNKQGGDNFIEVGDDGTILAKSSGETTYVTCSVTYYTSTGTNTLYKTVKIVTFTPISSIEVLDENQKDAKNITLYYAEDYLYFNSYLAKTINLKVSGEGNDVNDYEVSVDDEYRVDVEQVEGDKYEIKLNTGANRENATAKIIFTIKQYDKVYTITVNINIEIVSEISYINAVSEIVKSYQSGETVIIDDLAYDKVKINSNASFKNLLYIYVPENEDDKGVITADENGVLTATSACNGYIYTIAKDAIKTTAEYKKQDDFKNAYEACNTRSDLEDLLKSVYGVDDLTTLQNRKFAVTAIFMADGTEKHPYHINTVQDLVNINFTKHYVLRNDIDLSAYNWEALGANSNNQLEQEFSGSINGEFTVYGESTRYAIYGLKINVVRAENLTTTEKYYGLFAKTTQEACIKNLDLKNVYINISQSFNSYNYNRQVYIGALVAYNKGEISNVNIDLNTLNVKVSYTSMHVGGLVGINQSETLKNVKVNGNIDVNIENNHSENNELTTGGLIGKNLSNIDIEFRLFEDTTKVIVEQDYNYSGNINVSYKGQDVYTGGIVGRTEANLMGASANANITAQDFVGGVVGFATADINYCLFTGTIDAGQYVGGIVGWLNSSSETTEVSLSNCTVLIFDIDYQDAIIAGENFVGGIAGRINRTKVETSYIRSYCKDNVDILTQYTGGDAIYFGGAVGYAVNSYLERTYVYVSNMEYSSNHKEGFGFVGGLVGWFDGIELEKDAAGNVIVSENSDVDASTTDILYCFFKGKVLNITNPDNIAEEYNLVGSGATNSKTYFGTGKTPDDVGETEYWNIVTGYNDGDYITIDDNGNIMSIEPPTEIKASVKTHEGQTYSNLIKGKGHYKVDETTALVYYFKNNLNYNVLNLTNFVDISQEPSTANIAFLRYTSSNTDVVRMSMSNLIICGTGETTITITSLLNRSIKATIKIVVIEALTEFGAYISQDYSQELSDISVLLESKLNLYVKSNSIDVNVKIKLSVDDMVIMYDYDDRNGLEYYYKNLHKVLLKFTNEGEITINLIPIIILDGVEIQLLTSTENNYTLTIFKGLKSVGSDSSEGEIYLDEYTELLITANIHEGVKNDTTIDLDTDTTITVQNDAFKELDKTKQDELIDAIKDVIIIDDLTDSLENDTETIKDFLFKISVNADEFNKYFNSQNYLKLNTVTFEITLPVKSTHRGTTITKNITYTLIVHEQELYNISSKFYGYNQLVSNIKGETQINVNEIETDKVVGGQWGLLDIELFPQTAPIEKIEFSYLSSSGEILSVRQVVLNEEEKRYYTYNISGITDALDSTSLLPGQSLNLYKNNNKIVSTFKKPANPSDPITYNWTGHVYLSLLTRSSINVNTVFTLALKVYRTDNSYRLYTRTLGANIESNVSISYNGANNYGVLVKETILNDTIIDNHDNVVSQNLQINLTDVSIPTDYSNLYFEFNGSLVAVNKGSWEYTGIAKGGKQYTVILTVVDRIDYLERSTQLLVKITSTLEVKDMVTINAKIKTILSGKEVYYSSNIMNFTCALYYVTDIKVNGVKNGVYSKSIHSTYYLDTTINYIFAQSNKKEVTEKAQELQRQLGEVTYGKSNYFYATAVGEAQASELKPSNTYNNFVVDGELYLFATGIYRTKLVIRPKKISHGDTIFFSTKIKYDTDITLENYDYTYNSSYEQDPNTNIVYQGIKIAFTTDFYFNATEETHAQPISTAEELKSMKSNGYYRLTNDIVITEKWTPLDIDFKYLDGNGYNIVLAGGFNIVSSAQEDQEDAEKETEGAYGLFANIHENSIVLNLSVSLTSNKKYKFNETTKNYDVSESTDAKEYFNPASLDYIGYPILPELNGVDNMCVLNYNFSSSLADILYIGLLAGNNYGSIYNCYTTVGNSTLLKIDLNNNLDLGNISIGGIVGNNYGYITYSKSTAALTVIEASCNVGGLIGSNNGSVANCNYEAPSEAVNALYYETSSKSSEFASVAGLVAVNETQGKISYSYTSSQMGADTQIYSSLKAAGLVCVNKGSIENCYSQIKTDSGLTTSGFVYSNTGTILSSYSSSILEGNLLSVVEFCYINTGTISDCYYINSGYVLNQDEFAEEIKINTVADLSKHMFKLFVFGTKDERNGIWTLTSGDYPTLQEQKYIANISANKGNYSSWILDEKEVNQDETVYNWSKQTGYNGDEHNPIVIYSQEKFAEAFSIEETNFTYILANDIEFTDSMYLTSTDKTFTGVFSGNNMVISGITLNAVSQNLDYYGLFKQITIVEDNPMGIFKSVNLDFSEVYANTVKVVGALAGRIDKANIFNIKISGADTVVQGIYLVGGVAGIVNNSKLQNIEIELSINASYSGNEEFASSLNVAEVVNSGNLSNLKSSYAGVIAGAIANTTLLNINVVNNSRVLGYIAGSAVGYVDQNSHINYVNVLIDPEQYIYANFVAGGLVGENHGAITNSSVMYMDENLQYQIDTNINNAAVEDQALSYFKNKPLAIGGLVGVNFGTIQVCFSKIDVRNIKSIIAGGLVGVTVGGVIQNCYATGSVLSKDIAGGLIGSVTTVSTIVATVALDTKLEQAGTGIFTAGDLYQKVENEENKYKVETNKLTLNESSVLYNYVTDKDGGSKEYLAIVQSNMALNNYKMYKKAGKENMDYTYVTFFGTFIGSVYGELSVDGNVTSIGEKILKSTNFSYSIIKDVEEKTYYKTVTSISNMFNGNQVLINSVSNSANSIFKMYKQHEGDDAATKQYLVQDKESNNIFNVLYTENDEYVYIYRERKWYKKIDTVFDESPTDNPELLANTTGDVLSTSSLPETIRKFMEDQFTKAIENEVSGLAQSIANNNINKQSGYTILDVPGLEITLNGVTLNFNLDTSNVSITLGDNSTDDYTNNCIQIISRIDELGIDLSNNEALQYIYEKLNNYEIINEDELLKLIEGKNKYLSVTITIDTVIYDTNGLKIEYLDNHLKFTIDSKEKIIYFNTDYDDKFSDGNESFKAKFNEKITQQMLNESEILGNIYEKIIEGQNIEKTDINIIELSKLNIINIKQENDGTILDNRINTAKIFEEVFGEEFETNYNYYKGFDSTIFPYIDVNVNN